MWLALHVASLLIAGACKRTETSAATTTIAVSDTATTSPTQASATPPPIATHPSEVAEAADPVAVRVTNLRVSFDAHGSSGVVPWVSAYAPSDPAGPAQAVYQNWRGFESLYDYFLRAHAAAVIEAAQTVDHAKLLAARDEFESDGARDARVQTWLREVKAIFRQHVGGKDYEVFGLRVPAEAASYDANARGWVVAFPTLPDVGNLLGERYIAELLSAHPDVQMRLRSLPLVAPNVYIHPLRSEWSAEEKARYLAVRQGRLFVAMPDVNRAREFKERVQAGRVFYYLRFTPEMKVDWWGGPAAVTNTDFAVILHPTVIALYGTEPGEVIFSSAKGENGRGDLWFLTRGGAASPGGESE